MDEQSRFPDASSRPEGTVTERALRESQATYQRLVRTLDVIVWEADPTTFQFTFVSPQAEAVLGFPLSAWLDHPTFWVDHIHPEDLSHTLAFCQEQCRRRCDHQFEYRMLAADGRIVWILDKVRFSTTETGLLRLTGTMQDVSAQKADAEMRTRLEDELRQAQKMEAIGRLAGGIAHDFNNLLTVINGCSDLALGRLAKEDPLRELLLEIHKAGDRAATLTRQLLAFSRRQILKPLVLNLNSVLSDTEKLLRRLIGEDVLLTTILDPALGPVKADPGQLEQILINLAVNARDAMPRGGSLILETRSVTLDAAFVQTHPELRPGDYALLSVRDTGVGMSEATMAHVFEPFFTTKAPGKGTGMGLATVHGIVKQSGGHVSVTSQPGQGTTFFVYLPRVREPMPIGKSYPGTVKLPRGRETILLVEDEESVRGLGRHVLESCGYTVLEANEGRMALEVAGRHAGGIDLVVSDVVMPFLGGRELAEQIRGVRPRCQVLFMSGYTDDEVVRHGVLEEEFAFLQKPFTATQLAQKVREVLEGGK